MRLTLSLLVISGLAVLAPSSRAGITISAIGGTISAGGGTLDIPVYATSNSADSLGQFIIALDISASTSNELPALEFVSPLSVAKDPTLNALNYVYNPGNTNISPAPASADLDSDISFASITDPGSGFKTHFVGSDAYDGTDLSSGAMLLGNPTTPYLLANLVVTFSAPGTMTHAGSEVFNITLDTANSSFQDGFGNYISAIPNGNNIVLTTVTVTQAAAIPEPSTFVMSISAIVVGAVVFFRRRVLSAGR